MISFEPPSMRLMRASRYTPDLVFVHVAIATMELQAGVENVSLEFGGEELGLPYPLPYQSFASYLWSVI
jgi:hypothetical protein